MIDYSNYKTIKQLSEEIGVTRQAIHKKIKKEPLSSNLQRSILSVGNTVYINNDGVSLIKSVFIKDIGATSTLSTTPVDYIDQVDRDLCQKVDRIDNVDNSENGSVDYIDQVDSLSSKFIESLQGQIKTLTEQNQDLREQLNQERTHSREQSNKVISLAEQLAKLNENNQILLKKEQDKNTIFLSDQSESPEDKVKYPFWKFWKKRQ